MEMSKKENIAGRLAAGRVRLKLIVRDFLPISNHGRLSQFFRSYLGNRIHICRKKSTMTYLKQILHKTSELLFYQNENWHETRKAWDISINHKLTLFKVFSDLKYDNAWKCRTLNIQIFVFDCGRISKRRFKKIRRAFRDNSMLS